MTADDHVFTCRMTGKHGPKPEGERFSRILSIVYIIQLKWNSGILDFLESWNFGLFCNFRRRQTRQVYDRLTTGLRQVNDRLMTGIYLSPAAGKQLRDRHPPSKYLAFTCHLPVMHGRKSAISRRQ